MSLHTISVTLDKKNYKFEVGEYPHYDNERCKYKVFKDGVLVASFAPDRHHILHLCKNNGDLKEPLLHVIADKIEQLNPYGFFSL
jgi:hypothetical protein